MPSMDEDDGVAHLRLQVVNRLEGGLRSGMLAARPINMQRLALILIAVTLAAVWINGSRSEFIPCNQDCGETFIAQQSVTNYRLYGAKYRLLEDRSTIPDPDRRPYLYTHNVNLGGLVFPLLDRLGFSTLWAKQFVTLLVFGLSLFYVFLTTSYVTKSGWAGLCVLALFCSDYGQVFLFALNALRAWHWLALFGLLFHALRILTQDEVERFDLGAMSLFSFLAFAVGYEFLAIALGIAMFVAVLCARSIYRSVICLSWLAASVLLVFMLRQAQVLAVFGTKFWSTDFFYSAVIKVTSLAVYYKIPSLSEIDAYYQSQNVFRPFAAVAPFDQIVLGIEQHLAAITLPSIGVGATVSCIFGLAISAVIVVVWTVGWLGKSFGLVKPTTEPPSAWSRLIDGLKYHEGDWIDANLTARFYVSLVLGVIVSVATFGSVAISIYLKHQMPLMAAVVLIPKGVFVALCLQFVFTPLGNAGLRAAAATLAFLLISDHAAIQYQNVLALRPMAVGWIQEVAKRPDATFAVSWIPSSVAGFTRNWVVGVQPGLERKIMDRANKHQPLFNKEDLLEVNIGNTEEIEKYHLLQPDYWLYYPTDLKAELQANVPACVRSYSVRLFDNIFRPQQNPQLLRMNFSDLAGSLLVTGTLNVTGRAVKAIEFSFDGKVVAQAGMACDASSFAILLPMSSASALNELRQVEVTAIGFSDGRFPLGTSEVSLGEQPSGLSTVPPQRQPSPETMIELNRSLPVAATGSGFVLFDLRSVWGRR
jgi:hypothetical protein